MDTYERLIEKAKRDLDMLQKYYGVYLYFKKAKKSQNSYIVEMRRIWANKLHKEGLNLSEIGRIISKHHSTIIYLIQTEKDDSVYDEVTANMMDWIVNNQYPKTYSITEPSAIHKQGVKNVIKYKLVNL
jgi:IS30 family transposase